MAVLVAVGTASVVSLRASVLGIIDAQLAGAAEGAVQSVEKYRATPGPDGALPPPGSMKPLTRLIGQAPGNVVVLMRDGTVVDSAYFGDGDAQPAPSEASAAVANVSWADSQPRTVEVPGLGWYRMVGRSTGPDEVVVTGVSRAPAWDAMIQETVVVSGMVTLAVLVTALCTVAIVRFALRPLRRVAATAAAVAELPLDGDNHTIAPRVAVTDTDPRSEVGMVGVTLNRLLDHVERSLGDVAGSNRRMRQFITDASHELRTPLAAIHGYAELTRQDSDVLPETTEYSLARIESEAQRMSDLVSNLLLLARLDEGQDRHVTDVDVTELVVDAVNDAAVSAPTHHWLTRVPDGAVWVRADRAQLHQALANLLSNARVHTPEGTTVSTSLTTSPGDRHVEMTVTDDGPGIDAELLPHLFGRFVRADKSRSRETGSFGLGLSIAASIVESHGGTIEAESRSGTTLFSIRLPAAAAPVRTSEPSPASSRR
ncbi:HAMP domain-containing histidine kinase [Mycolicibacterium sp. 3033]|nr:HAMP domain-containing histidine kinase [Mycolicibacterium aurantiacum]